MILTALTTFAAFFSFGYCVADIILNRRAERRLDTFIKEMDLLDHD